MFDNQMPQVQAPQPVQTVVQPAPQPAVKPAAVPVKKGHGDLIKIIAIVALSLLSVTFIGLFIWMYMRYDESSTDVQGQINTAVAEAKDEQAQKDEAEFLEREKYPYQTFSGPADYGQLTFQYPKTWSVYVASDAVDGGDFKAYLNPVQVDAVSDETINALRVEILNESFENVASRYSMYTDKTDSELTMQSITFNGITGNRYDGVIPSTELKGIIVIFKIRDKTAVLRTDTVNFTEEFEKLLTTVEFNA